MVASLDFEVEQPVSATRQTRAAVLLCMIRLRSNQWQVANPPHYMPNMLTKTSISPVLTLLVPLNDHMLSITSTIIIPDRASMPATTPSDNTFQTEYGGSAAT